MVVTFLVAAAVAALTGLNAVPSRDEPVSSCHARSSGVDESGHRLVTFTDHTSQPGVRRQDKRSATIRESVASAVAALNATLSEVRLREAAEGDVQIVAVDSGTVGRTDLSCGADGSGGKATITLNRRYWTSPDTPVADHDRLIAVLHEFGHALGLAHSSDPCVVMHPNNSDCLPPKQIRFTASEAQTIDGLYRGDVRAARSPDPPFSEDVLPAPWPRD